MKALIQCSRFPDIFETGSSRIRSWRVSRSIAAITKSKLHTSYMCDSENGWATRQAQDRLVECDLACLVYCSLNTRLAAVNTW